MSTNKGYGYLIAYFIMFPLGFQIAKLLDQWKNHINEQMSGFGTVYLWIIVSGLAAALFLLVTLFLCRRSLDKCPSHKWITPAICVFHIILGILVPVFVPSQIMFMLFGYIFLPTYISLLVILLVFNCLEIFYSKRAEKNE